MPGAQLSERDREVKSGDIDRYPAISRTLIEAGSMGSLGGRPPRRPHALVIPLPHQGHWNPMKIFIRQLVKMNIPITVMSTPIRIAELRLLKKKGEFDHMLQDVELIEAFSDPPKKRMLRTVDTLEQMKIDYWAQPALKENLVAKKSAGRGPTFLLADMFCYWTQDVADDLGIPRYTYFTSPTTFALLVHHAPALIDNEYNPNITHKRNEIVDLPGMELFRVADICAAVFDIPETYKLQSKYLPKAAGILVNSWQSYEAAEVATLHNCLREKVGDHAKVPNIYLIGPVQPMIQSKVDLTAETDDSGCLKFLDTQSTESVLYICFGSLVELDQEVITELARGLELSGVPFVWVLPRPNRTQILPSWDASELLPEGFLSRTEGRGIVCLDWAPQVEILAHSSVGGFISHCGWNSLVETIRAGVAVIPWPWWAEQFMNARFVIDVAQVGVRIQANPDGKYMGEEVAKAVRLLMYSDQGLETKLRMLELKRTVEIAVDEGGSSHRAVQAFVKEICSLRN